MKGFYIRINSDLSEVHIISAVVRMVCEHLGFGPEDASGVELSVTEAVTNSIEHAYRGAPDGEVSVAVSYAQERLQVEIHDCGTTMPEQSRERLRTSSGVFDFDPSDLAQLPEGGMGLELIRQTMDEAVYSSDSRGNCLRLVKYLRRPEPKEMRI